MEYVPVLYAKQGELLALRKTEPWVRARIRPVLEVMPREGPARAVDALLTAVRRWLKTECKVAVDFHHLRLPREADGRALRVLSAGLAEESVTAVPVFRPGDGPVALAEAGHMHLLHRAGGCLRLTLDEVEHRQYESLGDEIWRVLRAVELLPSEVDLLLDAGHVGDEAAVERMALRAVRAVDWAWPFGWRSTALTSGAFPATLPRSSYRLQVLRRHDLDLWGRTRELLGGFALDYGDHGPTHVGRYDEDEEGPAGLRYLNGPHWYVMRAASARGSDCLKLYRRFTDSTVWPTNPAAFSWGAGQIAAYAARQDGEKSGGHRERRAWDTSHHLASVVRFIIRGGHP
ncbi:beta family protein [Kitasatospora viridis]|uniref:T4 beta protein n=1 Tax=Kitasatospora viridis TaxID=281105 RepID=A0A561TTL4_9ACTN|nr:hypothetical protein [Kitasatospora viridis]TWF90471.1 T4 beta protein [Kitasatospora viridis]